MTFSKIKTNGWQVNERLTHTQLNSLDTDHSNALDKTNDGYATGGGIHGIVDIMSDGYLRNVSAGGAPLITIHAGVLEVAGTLQMDVDSQLTSASTVTMLSGSTFTTNSGATVAFNGTSITQGSGCTNVMDGANCFGVTSVAANYPMGNGDTFVLVDTSTIAITVTLPPPQAGRFVSVKDKNGTAVTHNITINHNGTEHIDTAFTSATINTNYGCMQFVSNGTDWYRVAQF